MGYPDDAPRFLRQAALDVVLERGLEEATVEAICLSAGVSTATFFRYLTTKEEALVGGPLALKTRATQVFRRGGPTGDMAADLCYLLSGSIQPADGRWAEMRVRRQLIERYPLLLPRVLVRLLAVEDRVAGAVAARLRVCVKADLRPHLIAAVTLAALRVAFLRWTDHGGRMSLAEHLDDVFSVLRDDFLQPRSPR